MISCLCITIIINIKKTRIDFDDGNILWSIKSQMDMSHITERVLKNISSINFLEEEEPILVLKSLLYQQKVIMAQLSRQKFNVFIMN